MRRWAIALALGAALSFPMASFGDDVGEGESDAAGEEPAEAPSGSETSRESQEPEEPEEAEQAEESEASEEEEEPGFLAEYLESARTRALTGLNGIATAPADPVMATVETPKAFAKAGYVRRPLGFASGLLLMVYRTFSGTVDVGLSAIPWLPVVSPVPRYKLIPGFEHEDE
ncbi:MAG: hypothetical protein L0027_10050 [Candidatus Rokubacteria bacterium]|nr:hypothetical protein [Candidatus Rokubacteria bacterium]